MGKAARFDWGGNRLQKVSALQSLVKIMTCNQYTFVSIDLIKDPLHTYILLLTLGTTCVVFDDLPTDS